MYSQRSIFLLSNKCLLYNSSDFLSNSDLSLVKTQHGLQKGWKILQQPLHSQKRNSVYTSHQVKITESSKNYLESCWQYLYVQIFATKCCLWNKQCLISTSRIFSTFRPSRPPKSVFVHSDLLKTRFYSKGSRSTTLGTPALKELLLFCLEVLRERTNEQLEQGSLSNT